MFVRFVVSEIDVRTGRPLGLFSALYRLEEDGKLAEHELEWFRDSEEWLNKNLPKPTRFSKSTKHGAAYDAITWMKLSAIEHVRRMRDLAALLAYKDVIVKELFSDKPGYVVYEDEWQVAAVPFSSESVWR